MRTLKRKWVGLAMATVGSSVLCIMLTSQLLWGQTAPGLSIALSATNQVSLTVTNGATNGLYQIYFTESFAPTNTDWSLFTNGVTGQTNFTASMGDFEQGFFKAVTYTNSVPFSVVVIIQSPTNGSLVY